MASLYFMLFTTIIVSDSDSILCNDPNCTIDCTQTSNYDCSQSTISYADCTDLLDVICKYETCSNTIIYCPQECDIICVSDRCHHKNATVIYNDAYDNDIDIYCTNCADLTFSINNLHTNHPINLNIFCHEITWEISSCNSAIFSINATNIHQIYILCDSNADCSSALFDIHSALNSSSDVIFDCKSCTGLTIKAPSVKSLTLKCSFCIYINLYPPYSVKHSAQITGWSWDYIYIFVPYFYAMDFLLIDQNCAYRTGPSNAPRTGFKPVYMCCMHANSYSYCAPLTYFGPTAAVANRYKCKCGDDHLQMNCCPIAMHWTSYICVDDDCVVDFTTDKMRNYTCSALRIIANNVTSLSVIAAASSEYHSCDDIIIEADNVKLLNVTLFGTGSNTKIYARYVDYFILNCIKTSTYSGSTCNRMMVDVTFANNINIYANQLVNSFIEATHAHNISIVCQQNIKLTQDDKCSDVQLYVPIYNKYGNTSITCIGGNACNNFSIYTNNGLQDIHNLYINLCELCDGIKCANYIYKKWDVYCDGIICDRSGYAQQHTLANDMSQCLYIPPSQQRLFGIILAVTCCSIMCFIVAYLLYIMHMRYKMPQEYELYLYVYPPSMNILRYFYFVNLVEWISHIYFVVIIWLFVSRNALICSSMHDDYCAICAQCQHNCYVSASIGAINVLSFIIACSLFMFECLKIIRVFISTQEVSLSSKLMISGRDSFWIYSLKCYKTHFWRMYRRVYNARELFVYFKWKNKYIWRPVYCLFRYALLWCLIFSIHYEWNDIQGNIEWYELYSVFILWIVHECVAKYMYSNGPKYDERKHIIWIVDQIYGKNVTNIILQYVYSNYDGTKTPSKDDNNKTQLIQLTQKTGNEAQT